MNKNINIAWAEWLIEDCVRHGIEHFCIAPGSRSTPLTLAVANHPKCISHCHFDERGLGFFALGVAKAKAQTVALITTSGTAVANLYPAVIEAKQSAVPLLILSADRPHELIAVGANQAIEQLGIFAHYPVYQAQLAEPSLSLSPRSMLTELGHALAMQQQANGPIHLNCPYREPFYPEQAQQDLSQQATELESWLTGSQPYYQQHNAEPQATAACDWHKLNGDSKVLVVIGQQTRAQSQAIIAWAQQAGWPVVADCQSHWQHSENRDGMISQADLLLSNQHFAQHAEAELIIQFGGKLVSKRLNRWLAASNAQHYLIDTQPQRVNPAHKPQQRWQCQAMPWLAAHPVGASLSNADYLGLWQAAQRQIAPMVSRAIADYSELAICQQISALQGDNSALFMGNSMVVRMFELLGQDCKAKHYFCNRGASGIDGLLATSTGINQAQHTATTLVIGDTSLLHDINSLALASRCQSNLTIVLFNNQGGEIFKLLPTLAKSVKHHQFANDYYQMPHNTNFAAAANTFNLPYFKAANIEQFVHVFKQAQQQSGACLIEVSFASGDASARYKSLLAEVGSQDAL